MAIIHLLKQLQHRISSLIIHLMATNQIDGHWIAAGLLGLFRRNLRMLRGYGHQPIKPAR
jgi:hypothetical protein